MKRQNDESALATVKTVRQAQKRYESINGRGTFGTLRELANSNLVQPALSDNEEGGFTFELTVMKNAYNLVAVPKGYGTSDSQGNLTYFLDETGVIRSASNSGIDIPRWEIADSESPPIANQ